MTALTRALDTLKASLGELRSTLEARNAQVDGITAVAPIIMRHLEAYKYEKSKFEAALRSRHADMESFYRGLFVGSISSFESFVKMLISALVQEKCANVEKFSELPIGFRQQYVIKSAKVLANLGSGSVKGVAYNFAALQSSIGLCFLDKDPPLLEGDVFTVLMGNPTWTKLEAILESLGIESPFEQNFGSNSHIRGWAKAAWKRNLSQAKAKLDSLIDQRNLIVHAAQPVTIVEQDILDACDFFEAFGSALVDEMPIRLA